MADHNEPDERLRVDASPTKGFFVGIITKDIALGEAIEDLVDNCVDGAKRLRPGQNPDYSGLWIKLSVGGARFVIEDNCGGIERGTAQNYAFKFGRAAGFEETPFSVGQFGIGMKRALFKFGKKFSVHSVEPASSFDIEVDVQKWLMEEPWDFSLKNLSEEPADVKDTGTRIEVTELYDPVRKTFSENFFQQQVRQSIRVAQQHFMRAGLQIFFNDEQILPTHWQLKTGNGIEPSFNRYSDDLGGSAALNTRIYAGVGDSSTAHAGWYIFCNGRCILAADQSGTTGWKEIGDAASSVPRFHGQFARFRGYAFLECEDARLLPWNTTKTDLDLEAEAYRRLRGRLVDAMRPVIDFLNDLDSETDFEVDDRDLSRAVTTAVSTPLERLPLKASFSYRAPAKRGPNLVNISYKKPQPDADKLRRAMGATSYKSVGEQSFNHAFNDLVEDDQA